MQPLAVPAGNKKMCLVGRNKLCVVRVEDAVSAYVFYHYTQECRGICNVVGENGVTGRISSMFAESVAGKLHCKVESMTMKEAEESYGSTLTMVMSRPFKGTDGAWLDATVHKL